MRPDNSFRNEFLDHAPALRRWLAQRLRVDADIEDALQDIWVRICARPQDIPVENGRSYLFQVARSVVADRHRRAEVRLQSRHETLEEMNHPVEVITPERVFIARQDMVSVSAVIASLPERTRDIFLLNRFDGMSYREIAAAMELSVSAVEKHMMKALKMLMNRDEDGKGE